MTPTLVQQLRRSQDLAIVRTSGESRVLQEGPGGFGWTSATPVDLVRSAGPHGAVPEEGFASLRTFQQGEVLVAARSDDGRWRLHATIGAGGRAWAPARDFTPRQFAEAASEVRRALQASDDAALHDLLLRMLRSKNPLARGAALDLLGERRLPASDRLYAAVTRLATCDDPLSNGALRIVESRRYEAIPVLQRLLRCPDENRARAAHHRLQRECPIHFERARAPATRNAELAHFDWCWREKQAEARAEVLSRRLRSDVPAEVDEALREIESMKSLDYEPLFEGLREATDCGDAHAPRAIAQLARFDFERSLPILRPLLGCADPATRDASHRELTRHCPLDLDRLADRDARWAEYEGHKACLAAKGIKERSPGFAP